MSKQLMVVICFLPILACYGDIFNDSFNEEMKWELVTLVAERTTSGDTWCDVAVFKYNGYFYYVWYGNVEGWNQRDCWVGRIESVSPSSNEHVLLSTITHDGHPYQSTWSFDVNSTSMIEVNGVFYMVIYGQTGNMKYDDSLAIIKSTNGGATWQQHQLVFTGTSTYQYQAADLVKIGSDVYLYYRRKNLSTSTTEPFYIATSQASMSFETANAVACNTVVNYYNQVLYYSGRYIGFRIKRENGRDYVYRQESVSPSFESVSEEDLFMEPGISEYDTYYLQPYYVIDSDFLYCMARTDPSLTTNYGFTNESKLCLYCAPLRILDR